jgi:hypothetical protein
MTPDTPPTDPPASEAQRFVLTIEVRDDPGGVPPYSRLRRFLKQAQRAYGIRALEVRPAAVKPAGGSVAGG